MNMTTHLIKIHVFTQASHVTNFSLHELCTIRDGRASGACTIFLLAAVLQSYLNHQLKQTESVWLRSLCSNTQLQNGTGAMARHTHSCQAAIQLNEYFSVNKRH